MSESKVAPLSPETFANLSGLDILRRMLSGDLPAPPFARTTQIGPVSAEMGVVIFEGTPSAEFLNPLGVIHGGWIATLLDSAMACAVQSALRAGQTYTTLDLNVRFIRALRDDSPRIRCEGRVIHVGSRVATAEGRVTDASGRVIAHGTESCLVMDVATAPR